MDIAAYRFQFDQTRQALEEAVAQLNSARDECGKSRAKLAHLTGSSSRSEAAEAAAELGVAEQKFGEAVTQIYAATATIEAYTSSV